MPDLRNVLKHAQNTKILVNGTTYDIDADGLCKGVSADDAKRLLSSDAWTSELKATKKPDQPVQRPKAVLLTEDDTPVDGQKAVKTLPTPESAPEVIPVGVVPVEAIPEEGEEWPDPTEDMDIEYLRKMADAYEVSWHHRSGAAKLVKDIKEAMYE